MRSPYPRVALTLVAFVAIVATPGIVPALKDYTMLDWRTIPSVLEFTPRKSSSTPVEDEHIRPRPDTDPRSYGVHPILDASHNLDSFYAALDRTERRVEGAVTRIVHYGDSPTTADLITSDVRALLQEKFGDAGHGFCLVAKPWAWYGHRGLELSGSGWIIDPANQADLRDGLYGLGGVSFRGSEGVSSRIRLRDGSHTRIEISFLREPGGGKFTVEAEGEPLGEVDTAAEAAAAGFSAFAIPAGARRFDIRVTAGKVRLFGARFEKPGPGVVYHSLGLNGAYVSVLARLINEKHWAEQLRHHQPDLVIVNYGTNESMYANFVDYAYAKEARQIVARVRASVPSASIMFMSPMDRGQRLASGEIGTVPVMTHLVALQQKVAGEAGCAFFNTFEAMGGPGTMGRWYQTEPRLVSADFIHPMPAGARIVGNLLNRALLDGYNRWKLRRLQSRFAKIKP